MSDAASKDAAKTPDDGVADPDEFLFHLFTVLTRHRDARLDSILKPLNLNVSRHRALAVIASFEPCTMTELAEFSCVDRTTMTRTVDHLVAGGLVERFTPPRDRRHVLMSLTAAGREVYRQARSVIVAANKELLAGAPEDGRRAMIRVQRRIIANLIGDEAAVDRIVNFRRPENAAKT
jgi:DNA-binding MarR family transcriptional regulator